MKHRDSNFLYKGITLFIFSSFCVTVLYFSFSHIHRQRQLLHSTSRNRVEGVLEDDNSPVEADKLSGIKINWPQKEPVPDLNHYPKFKTLLGVVSEWNPDIPDPPEEFTEVLQHFDYSNAEELAIAERYRDAELPFKLYNIPEFAVVGRKWTDRYLTQKLAHDHSHTERSKNNHFLYWTMHGHHRDPDYVPPTEIVRSTFQEWREIARRGDEMKINASTEHFYFMTGSDFGDREGWISKDLPSLNTDKRNFFITNVEANKGTQCRFGMRGIVAASHYDTGRNMIAMLKGNKRYILNPPSACKRLGIITDRKHPSFRHSIIDWSDVAQAKASGFHEVQAIDTIVRTGEVLYIPSFWFHYIISLDYSIQCNSRSGTPPGGQGLDDIQACLGGKLNLGEGKKKRQERRKKKKKMMD